MILQAIWHCPGRWWRCHLITEGCRWKSSFSTWGQGGGLLRGLITTEMRWKSQLYTRSPLTQPSGLDQSSSWQSVPSLTLPAVGFGGGHFVTAQPGWKSRFSTMSLLGGLEQQLLGWCLAAVEPLLSKSFLSYWAAPFLILWLERRAFSWGCCLSMPIGIFRMLASPASRLGCIIQKENPGNSLLCHSLGLKFSSHLSEWLLLFTLQSSYACFMYNDQCS